MAVSRRPDRRPGRSACRAVRWFRSTAARRRLPSPGDLLLFAYVLGLMRFFTVLAALDTGSSFEGMGASREVFFSALAEPALLLGLATVARRTGTLSLSELLAATSATSPELVLVLAALGIVFLCENARIPFDDPDHAS